MAEQPVREAFTPRHAVTYETTGDGPRVAPDQVVSDTVETAPAAGAADTEIAPGRAGAAQPDAPADPLTLLPAIAPRQEAAPDPAGPDTAPADGEE